MSEFNKIYSSFSKTNVETWSCQFYDESDVRRIGGGNDPDVMSELSSKINHLFKIVVKQTERIHWMLKVLENEKNIQIQKLI